MKIDHRIDTFLFEKLDYNQSLIMESIMRTSIIIKLFMTVIAFYLCLPSECLAGRKKRYHGQTVALWKLNSLGLDDSVRRTVRKGIVSVLKKDKDWQYVSFRTVLNRLKRSRISKTAPVGYLARAAKAKFFLVGTLAGIGGNVSLDLKVLDGRDGHIIRRQSIVLPKGKPALVMVLGELLTRLLSPHRWVGSLSIGVSENGADIFLDGIRVATTPLKKPLEGISPDKHILMIRKKGFGDFSQFVVVRYHQLAKLEVDLASATLVGLIYEKKVEASTVRPKDKKRSEHGLSTLSSSMGWQKIAGWVCLGLGVVSLGSGGLLAWHADELEGDIARGWWSEGNEGILRSKLSQGRRVTNWSKYSFTAGGSFVLLASGLLLWGYLAETDDSGDSGTRASPSAIVVPLCLPSGAGLGLLGRF